MAKKTGNRPELRIYPGTPQLKLYTGEKGSPSSRTSWIPS